MGYHSDEAHANPDVLFCAECNFQGMLAFGMATNEIQREKHLLEDFARYAPMVRKYLEKAGFRLVKTHAPRGANNADAGK